MQEKEKSQRENGPISMKLAAVLVNALRNFFGMNCKEMEVSYFL
jgi:hypothetical protein